MSKPMSKPLTAFGIVDETLTAFGIVDETLPTLVNLGTPDCNGARLSDDSVVYVSARLDFDYLQFLMLDVRRNDETGETMCDHLFAFLGPHKRSVEWDNHPCAFFDCWKQQGMEPYLRFVEWAENELKAEAKRSEQRMRGEGVTR